MSKKQRYAQRLLRIAADKSRLKYTKGTKDEQLVYQLGFVVGMLSKYAEHDISIKQDIAALEHELGIVYKDQ